MEHYITGFVLGLSLSLSIGPGFIGIFQTTLNKGFRSGLSFAAGIWISDLCVFLITFYWAYLLVDNIDNQRFIALVGGVVLLIFGMLTFWRTPKLDIQHGQTVQKGNLSLIRGFLFNIANPFAYIFWLGISSIAGSVNEVRGIGDYFILYAGVFTSGFGADIVKCALSGWIRSRLKGKMMLRLHRLSALIILMAGLYIFLFKGLLLTPH